MSIKSRTSTRQILEVMKILAWVAFIGYLIEAGAILISFGVSIVNPDAAMDLYQGRSLYELRQFNLWHYVGVVSFLVTLGVLKAVVWYLVIKTLTRFNLKNPFKMEVALKLERISYLLFSTWVVGMASSAHTSWLVKVTGKEYGDWVSGEFIFMAGLVFVISQIFKRGVEIQAENELTV